MPFHSTNPQTPHSPQAKKSETVKPKQPEAYDDLQFMTVAEVAKLLHIGAISVYRLADRGEIPSYRILRKRLFKRKDIMTYIESCAFPAIKR